MSKPELGLKLLKKLIVDIGETGIAEGSPEMAGNRMHLVFGPSKKPVPAKRPASVAAAAPAPENG
jgi:translation initiation factor IF-3